jgi:hypothetical protein
MVAAAAVATEEAPVPPLPPLPPPTACAFSELRCRGGADGMANDSATTTDDVTLFLNPTGSRVIWGGPENSALKARVLSALIANYPLGSVSTYDVSAPTSAVVS